MKNKLSDFELGWLVGILEGEGHFDFNTYSQKVQLRMTDEDTVSTYAQLIGKVIDIKPEVIERYNGPNRQTIYEVNLSGERARAIMKLIVKHLHYRRRQKVWQSLNRFRTKKLNVAEVIKLLRKVS